MIESMRITMALALAAAGLTGAPSAVSPGWTPSVRCLTPSTPPPNAATQSGLLSTDALLLPLCVFWALMFSLLCSVAEATLLSITPADIAGMREEQPKKAVPLRRLKEDNIDQSLAAILTVNALAHTVGAVGAGAKATAVNWRQLTGLSAGSRPPTP